mmetsp:Transcript_1406/g.3119  ORF Transcript_1406/g.3119 Transcript_1406/m.3119 type:complete len:471 (+) Transcript_1406:102-1514(+)
MPLTVRTVTESPDNGMEGSECDPLSPHVRFYGPHNRTDLSIDDTDSSIGRSGMSSSNDFDTSLNRSGEFRALRWQRGCLKHFMTSEGCHLQGCPFLHELTKQEVALLIAQTKQEHHILFSTSHSSSLNDSAFDEHNTPSHHLAVSGGGVPQTLEEGLEEEENLDQPEMPQYGGDPEDDQDDNQEEEDQAPRQERRRGTQRWEVQEKQTSDWVRHSCGICKPCFFFATPEGCTDSDNCRFCHFPHDLTGQRIKLRPCKGKRDRYRKFLNRVTQEMQALADPDDFDIEGLQLPSSVLKNEVLKRMFMSRVVQHVEGVKAKLKAGLVPEILGEDNNDAGDNQSNTQTTSETVPETLQLGPAQQQLQLQQQQQQHAALPNEIPLQAQQQEWREAAFQHQQQQQQQQQQQRIQDQNQQLHEVRLEQQQKWNQAPPPPSAKPCPQAGGVVNCGAAALKGRGGRATNTSSRRSVISL